MTVRKVARSAALLVVLVLLGAAVSAGLSLVTKTKYTSTAQVLIRQRDYTQAILGTSGGGVDPLRQLTTASVAATSVGFRDEVASRLPGTTPAQIRRRLTVTVVDGADVLELAATAPTAAASQRLASVAATAFTHFYERTLLNGVADLGAAGPVGTSPDVAQRIARAAAFEKISPSASVLSDASSGLPSGTRPKKAAVLGGLAGLVVGLLFLAWRSRSVVTPDGAFPLARRPGRPEFPEDCEAGEPRATADLEGERGGADPHRRRSRRR